ncbi:MAG: hypothetical protein ACYTFA_04095 [Planctomycetota bacterium]|jgi:hypothetical protein
MQRVAPALAAMLAAVNVALPSLAQRPPGASHEPVPFERYVPASAKLFVTIRKLGEMDAALHRAHAWRLLPMIAGAGSGQDGPFDLRAAVKSLAGGNRPIEVDELMEAEVGIAAASWSQLGSAVWFVRISDEDALKRWFPGRRARRGPIPGRPMSFRMRDGMDVCVQDDVAAMTRRTGSSSSLREVRRLMSRGSKESLGRSEIFQELVSYLPARHLGIAYISSSGTSATDSTQSSTVWPALDRVAIGLYEREGRIDLAIRGSRAIPQTETPLAEHAIMRLMGLPQTTLFAAATTIDLDSAYKATLGDPSRGVWQRYLAILTGLARHAADRSQPGSSLGPHVIFAWGQDLSEHGSTPQVAVMVECTTGQRLQAEVKRIAGNMVKLVGKTHGMAPEAVPTIERTVHLGTPIEHLPLKRFAAESQFRMAPLLGNADPAWAVWRNWFIFALTRDHLVRILDAQHGLTPTLAGVRDAQELQRQQASRSVIAIAQPELARDVMDRWIKDYEAGALSLLAPSWWAKPPRPEELAEARLGVALRPGGKSGVVVVADVPTQSAAQGHLRVGDRIIGIDGHLLDLKVPNVDFSGRLTQSTTEGGPTLRVQRDRTMMDVVVSWNPDREPVPGSAVQPADAVRELASLGHALRLATFSVHSAGETRYSARLSLRFSADTPP